MLGSSEILEVLKGKGSKKEHGIYLTILFIFFLACLGISQLLYPAPGYDWTNRYISEEGNPGGNPRGWYFFSLGICGTAIFLIPHFLYIYRNLQPSVKLLNKFSLFCMIIGSMGLFIVGTINEDYEMPHNVAAAVAFGSIGLAAFFILIILMRKMILKDPWPRIGSVILFYSCLIIMGIFVTQGTITLTLLGEKTSFYQWISLWIMISWMFGMYLIIPAKD